MSKKPHTELLHFRVDTIELLHEIANCAIGDKMGILKIPLNVLRINLAAAAERATKLNDPILNRAMFDLGLYETPEPSSAEYSKMMKKIYRGAEKQMEMENTVRKNHNPKP